MLASFITFLKIWFTYIIETNIISNYKKLNSKLLSLVILHFEDFLKIDKQPHNLQRAEDIVEG